MEKTGLSEEFVILVRFFFLKKEIILKNCDS